MSKVAERPPNGTYVVATFNIARARSRRSRIVTEKVKVIGSASIYLKIERATDGQHLTCQWEIC